MANLGWSATVAVNAWLREGGLDTCQYLPVTKEELKEAAKKAGLTFWGCADGEEIILSFREGAVWPPKGVSGFFFSFRRYIPRFLRSKLWKYPPNRYIELKGSSSTPGWSEPAPAWVCRTPVEWVRGDEAGEIVAVKTVKELHCKGPRDSEWEYIQSPTRILEKEILGDQTEEVIPTPSPLVEVSLPDGKVIAFEHEARRLVEEAEERERGKLEEVRQSLKALAEMKRRF